MLLTYAIGVLVSAFLCTAQSPTTEPCAQVGTLLASSAKKTIPASLAEACALSAPIVEDDALKIIEGLTLAMNWQSTNAWLQNPPSGYPFPALNITRELLTLGEQIKSGVMRSEILFERSVASILNRAHDGHLRYPLDGMDVFTYRTGFGSLSVVSLDGQQAPGIYITNELTTSVRAPSAVTAINGVNAVDWLVQQGMNSSRFQDLDAIFNDFMRGPPLLTGVSSAVGSFDSSLGFYRGNSTTLRFENGTEETRPNFATTTKSFLNVVDGKSFSLNFCNATEKARKGISANAAVKNKAVVGINNSTKIVDITKPVIAAPDGSISGHFLANPGFEDTAVLVIQTFESTLPVFQRTLAGFLNQCRAQNKKRLVIDVTANGGGVILLVYEVFKQLFPDIDPFLAGNLRADDALNVWGQAITQNAQKFDPKKNLTAYIRAGGFGDYDARGYLNENGSSFGSWPELFGPVSVQGDKFTNLFRWPYQNSGFVGRGGNLSISNTNQQGPRTFDAKNIVIMGDGKCSSSCTLLSHLLKWQGKVKSIAVGGRPQTGPMQQQGGVKGAEVQNVRSTVRLVNNLLTSAQQSNLKNTVFPRLSALNDVLSLRTTSDLSYNVKNNIAEGDATLTPLQFVYEAADCRLFVQPSWLLDYSPRWLETARQAFGLNNTVPWSGCVKDSTGHPSSLSGNTALFNKGVANNVTGTTSTKDVPSKSNGSGSGGGSSNFTAPATLKNEGERRPSPVGFAVIVFVVAAVLAI